MVSKVNFGFKYTAGTQNVYRPSLPYSNKFTTVSSMVADIEGNTYTSAKLSQVLLWNPYTQSSNVYQYNGIAGKWLGVDYPVDAGTSSSNALYFNVLSNFNWIVSGKDTITPLYFYFNAPGNGLANSNKRCLPYGSIYLKASDVVNDLEGGTGAGTDTKINKVMVWDAGLQAFKTYIYNTIVNKWLGEDFIINPGDSITLYPVTSFTWTPKLAITPVP